MITAEETLVKNKVFIEPTICKWNLIIHRDTHILAQENIKRAMIEFAKIHVAEARKQFKIVFSEIDDVYPFERDDRLSDVYPLSSIK